MLGSQYMYMDKIHKIRQDSYLERNDICVAYPQPEDMPCCGDRDPLQTTPQTTLTDQNSIAEEIKSRLRSGNACYHSVQNLLSSRLLSKNLKIKIYRTIILPVVLYGCETWSLTLREERKLRVFENMVLRRIFGPKRDEVMVEWRRLHNEELNDLYS